MPNTGLFYVLNLDLALPQSGNGREGYVRSVTVRCNACLRITTLSGQQLGSVVGGTLLTCYGCLAQQAVSNARLVECDHVLNPNE